MPDDVLEKLSSVIGRKVEPVKPAAPAQPSTPAQHGPTAFENPLEKVIGRSLQPVKLPDMAASRFSLYSKARGNGFDAKKAAGVAMSQAGTVSQAAQPTTWDQFKTPSRRPRSTTAGRWGMWGRISPGLARRPITRS
jgi:hypothetical protein